MSAILIEASQSGATYNELMWAAEPPPVDPDANPRPFRTEAFLIHRSDQPAGTYTTVGRAPNQPHRGSSAQIGLGAISGSPLGKVYFRDTKPDVANHGTDLTYYYKTQRVDRKGNIHPDDDFPAVAAQATLTMDTEPADDDTITLGSITYRFKTVLALAGDILRGDGLAAVKARLVGVINGVGVTSGVDYFAGTTTPHTEVTAAAFVGDDSVITAITPGAAGNSLASTISATGGNTFDGATLGTTQEGRDYLQDLEPRLIESWEETIGSYPTDMFGHTPSFEITRTVTITNGSTLAARDAIFDFIKQFGQPAGTLTLTADGTGVIVAINNINNERIALPASAVDIPAVSGTPAGFTMFRLIFENTSGADRAVTIRAQVGIRP